MKFEKARKIRLFQDLQKNSPQKRRAYFVSKFVPLDRSIVKEVGKEKCNKALARLSANDSRFNLSSEDLVIEISGLIIRNTSVPLFCRIIYRFCVFASTIPILPNLCSILPPSSHRRLLQPYQYSPQFH